MKKQLLTFGAVIAGMLTPAIASAQYIPQGGDAKVLFIGFLGIVRIIPQLIFAIAIIAFLLRVIQLFLAPTMTLGMFPPVKDGDNKGAEVAKMIGALFVIFAIYGIIAVISNTLGIGVGGKTPPQPEIPVFDGIR